jgi:hypothetical protein
VSANEGRRGGGAASAQRRNLSPAQGDKQATYRDVLVGHSGAASGEPAVGSGPTGPVTEGRRGGGAALAQRRNLSPARGNGPTTFRSEMAARDGTFRDELAASGEPANSKYHSSPAYVTEPCQHTPVDYEEMLTPVLFPSARNLEEAAKPWDGDIDIHRRLETSAEWFAPPSCSAGMWQGRPASPPRTAQGISGRVAGRVGSYR